MSTNDSDSETKSAKTSKAPKVAKKYTNLTKEEQIEFLKDSILVNKEQWKSIPINSYISYIKGDDKFVKGGYVKLIYNKKDADYIVYGTKLDKYTNDKYYKEFTINLTNIKEIYKKVDQSAISEYKIIKNNIAVFLTTFTNEITKINNKFEEVEKKIIKLEENHIKTLKLIKNLHNIKSLDDVKHLSK